MSTTTTVVGISALFCSLVFLVFQIFDKIQKRMDAHEAALIEAAITMLADEYIALLQLLSKKYPFLHNSLKYDNVLNISRVSRYFTQSVLVGAAQNWLTWLQAHELDPKVMPVTEGCMHLAKEAFAAFGEEEAKAFLADVQPRAGLNDLQQMLSDVVEADKKMQLYVALGVK